MELRATPTEVLGFVMTPERILDYYPDPIEGGVFEDGRAIWCRGAIGVSMLERVDDKSSGDCLVVLVTTAVGLEPPYTPESIRAGATFTMVEDWAVAATTDGTTLTKSVARRQDDRRSAVLDGGRSARDVERRERTAGREAECRGASRRLISPGAPIGEGA